MSPIRIATRGSDLALAQARYVAGRIERELESESEIVVLKTTGDRIQNVSLAKIGGKGLFVKEIEEALLDDRADVAVHSAKDLPATIAPGLTLAAFPQRADSRDALIARERGATLAGLPPGARLGTGSARRGALALAARPDLEIVPLRGNVPTRLRKLEDERLDAIVLACAGLDRLELNARIDERIETGAMLPAVGQGALALESRSDDPLAARLAALDDPDSAVCVHAERGFLLRLGGDCTVPLACLAQLHDGNRLHVRGLVASALGEKIVRAETDVERTTHDAAAQAGSELAAQVLAAGGSALLDALREEPARD